MSIHRSQWLAIVSLCLGSCDANSGATSSAEAPRAGGSAVTVTQQLDALDPRAPVPLLPQMANHQKQNMRDHLLAVQEVVAALSASDVAGAGRAAARLGYSKQMGQMCNHMGAGAPGFTEQAIQFHKTADRMVAAAEAGDGAGVLSELGATLQTCTSCHARWRQQIVDAPTWQRLTSARAPARPMHH